MDEALTCKLCPFKDNCKKVNQPGNPSKGGITDFFTTAYYLAQLAEGQQKASATESKGEEKPQSNTNLVDQQYIDKLWISGIICLDSLDSILSDFYLNQGIENKTFLNLSKELSDKATESYKKQQTSSVEQEEQLENQIPKYKSREPFRKSERDSGKPYRNQRDQNEDEDEVDTYKKRNNYERREYKPRQYEERSNSYNGYNRSEEFGSRNDQEGGYKPKYNKYNDRQPKSYNNDSYQRPSGGESYNKYKSNNEYNDQQGQRDFKRKKYSENSYEDRGSYQNKKPYGRRDNDNFEDKTEPFYQKQDNFDRKQDGFEKKYQRNDYFDDSSFKKQNKIKFPRADNVSVEDFSDGEANIVEKKDILTRENDSQKSSPSMKFTKPKTKRQMKRDVSDDED